MFWAVEAVLPLSLVELLREMGMETSNSLLPAASD
jgi:hypothetical protein